MTRAAFVNLFPHMSYMHPSATDISYSILGGIPSAMFVQCTYVNPVGRTVQESGYCASGLSGPAFRTFRVTSSSYIFTI